MPRNPKPTIKRKRADIVSPPIIYNIVEKDNPIVTKFPTTIAPSNTLQNKKPCKCHHSLEQNQSASQQLPLEHQTPNTLDSHLTTESQVDHSSSIHSSMEESQNINSSSSEIGGLSDSDSDSENDIGYDFIFKYHRELILDLISEKFKVTRTDLLHKEGSVTFVSFIFDLLQILSSSQLAKTEMSLILQLLNRNFSGILTSKLCSDVDTLFNRVADIKKEYKRIYYCNCSGVEHVCNSETKQCPICKKSTKLSIWIKDISSWISGFIKSAGGIDNFRKLLKTPNKNTPPKTIDDVTQSLEYERITMNWNLKENSLPITISIGTDGGKVFKSGTSSVWPLFGWVNELDMALRFSYPFTMLLGYSSKKVDMNFFLNYLVDELLKLDQEGIVLSTDKGPITLHARLFMLVSDLVAISEILYLNGANGFCCCRWCDILGKRKDDRILFGKTYGKRRDWDKIIEFYRELVNSGTDQGESGETCIFQGIKKMTVLVKLPYFRWSTQVSGDILHNLLEGLCKKIAKVIVKRYDITEINKKIDNINVPSMYHRNLRNLSNLGHYKAIEYYMLFAYNVHVFEGTVTRDEMVALTRLESLISQFMSPIKDGEIYHLELYKECTIVIDMIERLFGEHINTLSTHTVSHFPDSLVFLGPLYLTSTFMLEDLVGRIIKPIQGGKYQMDQKALQMWTIMQMTSIKKYRIHAFQLGINDYLYSLELGGYFRIKKKPTETEPSFILMKIEEGKEEDMHTVSELPEDCIPCFKSGSNSFKHVRRADKFLL